MRINLAKWVTLIVAVLLAGCAGAFSVYGLSHLFGGAAIAVMVMATVLEIGKLIGASVLERFYKTIGIWFTAYLTIAVLVLMVITSMGIYGFLSNAYQTTYSQLLINDQTKELVIAKKTNFETQKADFDLEKDKLDQSIADLRTGLSNPAQVQYIDRETGEKITTTSSSTRRALESQLTEAISRRNLVSSKIESLNDSIANYGIQIIELDQNNEAAAELGPIRFIAERLNWSMNSVANSLILLFVIVFDPLAVVLVVVSNRLFEVHDKQKEREEQERTGEDARQSNPTQQNPISGEIQKDSSQYDTSGNDIETEVKTSQSQKAHESGHQPLVKNSNELLDDAPLTKKKEEVQATPSIEEQVELPKWNPLDAKAGVHFSRTSALEEKSSQKKKVSDDIQELQKKNNLSDKKDESSSDTSEIPGYAQQKSSIAGEKTQTQEEAHEPGSTTPTESSSEAVRERHTSEIAAAIEFAQEEKEFGHGDEIVKKVLDQETIDKIEKKKQELIEQRNLKNLKPGRKPSTMIRKM